MEGSVSALYQQYREKKSKANNNILVLGAGSGKSVRAEAFGDVNLKAKPLCTHAPREGVAAIPLARLIKINRGLVFAVESDRELFTSLVANLFINDVSTTPIPLITLATPHKG